MVSTVTITPAATLRRTLISETCPANFPTHASRSILDTHHGTVSASHDVRPRRFMYVIAIPQMPSSASACRISRTPCMVRRIGT